MSALASSIQRTGRRDPAREQSMKTWDQRPREVRTLFNPAFCGLVLARAIEGFTAEGKSTGQSRGRNQKNVHPSNG